MMPLAAIADIRLSMGARLVLAVLWGRGPGPKARKVYAPKPSLQAMLAVSRQTMDRYVRELASAGWAEHDHATWVLSDPRVDGDAPKRRRRKVKA